MSEQPEHNGHNPRVSFGDKEWQNLQLDVASMVLTLFKQRQPALFGAYLAEVMTGAKPKAGRS